MGASELTRRHPDAWRVAVDHPFLRGVRDGSLPPGAFDAWLRQDHIFVADLLGFQARLLAGAPRAALAVLARGLVALEAELSWFEEHGRRRGLAPAGTRHPTTEEYRRELERLLDEPFAIAMTGLWALEPHAAGSPAAEMAWLRIVDLERRFWDMALAPQ